MTVTIGSLKRVLCQMVTVEKIGLWTDSLLWTGTAAWQRSMVNHALHRSNGTVPGVLMALYTWEMACPHRGGKEHHAHRAPLNRPLAGVLITGTTGEDLGYNNNAQCISLIECSTTVSWACFQQLKVKAIKNTPHFSFLFFCAVEIAIPLA